jgi:DNA-binding Xre family transcriptional regulator
MMRKKRTRNHRQLSASGARVAAVSAAVRLKAHELLAAKLRRILEERRVSERELARRTGYKLRFVREILGGRSRRLSLEGMEKVAAALGVDVTDLVGNRAL